MLVWRDAMSAGHPEVDSANKQLIARVNLFQKTLSQQTPRVAIGMFLTGLYELASINFHHEETIQRECAFTFQDKHAREHASLLNSVLQVSDQYHKLGETADHAHLLREVAALIKDWLTEHIVHSDAMLKPYWQRRNGIFPKVRR